MSGDFKSAQAAMEATAAAAEKPIPVEIKEWGGTFYVRALQTMEMDEQILEDSKAAKEDRSAFARGVIRLMCDENGARNWSTQDAEQVQMMKRQPWTVTSLLTSAVSRDEEAAPKA